MLHPNICSVNSAFGHGPSGACPWSRLPIGLDEQGPAALDRLPLTRDHCHISSFCCLSGDGELAVVDRPVTDLSPRHDQVMTRRPPKSGIIKAYSGLVSAVAPVSWIKAFWRIGAVARGLPFGWRLAIATAVEVAWECVENFEAVIGAVGRRRFRLV